MAIELTDREKTRYTRQMMLEGWGEETQKKLKSTNVFIAGAGGLGSPVAVNLAVAGVGRLTICDFDSPELSNLNRQFLHNDSRIGINKAESAKLSLSAMNPDIEVVAITERIDANSVSRLIGDSDLIMDCLDNFQTRRLLNGFAAENRVPMVHGSIWGLEGRVMFIDPPHTACLCCLFPDAPKSEIFPVLGATPGITGAIQAMEAIKFLTGTGRLLRDKYLVADFATMEFRLLNVRKNPDCPVCAQAD